MAISNLNLQSEGGDGITSFCMLGDCTKSFNLVVANNLPLTSLSKLLLSIKFEGDGVIFSFSLSIISMSI